MVKNVECCVCNVKKLVITDEDELEKINKTYLNELKLLLYICKWSLCGQYNYPARRFENII